MTTYVFKNNAASTLAATALLADVTITLATGEGDRFPAPGTDEVAMLTIQNGSAFEIVACTSRAGDILTVARAQDGTASQTWTAGSSVDQRLPAGVLAAFAQTPNVVQKAGDTMAGPLLLSPSVSTTAPPIAFDGDSNTGLARPAPDLLALVTGGIERLRVAAGQIEAKAVVGLQEGNAGAPSLARTGDENTGMYFPAANEVAFATGGIEILRISASNITMSVVPVVPSIIVTAGTAAAPSISVSGDLNTGILFPAADTIGFAVGGVQHMSLTPAALTILVPTGVVGDFTVVGNAAMSGALEVTGTLSAGVPAADDNDCVVFSQFEALFGSEGSFTIPKCLTFKCGASTTAAGVRSITFPVPFGEAFYGAVAVGNGATGPTGARTPLTIGASQTVAGFNVYGLASENLGFFWVAWGKN